MAELAESRASSSDVKKLAEKIKEAQDPEIETMSGWLRAWGQKVPEDMDHDGMDHGDASAMPRMMDDWQMDELEGASGKAFDRMFLTTMIGHHQRRGCARPGGSGPGHGDGDRCGDRGR
ncbi:DUF305 domain-containing protein [Streptomyces nigrescens]